MNTALKQLSETEEHNEEHSTKQLPETKEHNEEHSFKEIIRNNRLQDKTRSNCYCIHTHTQMYTHEDLGNLAAEPTAGVRMETSEYETPGANSGNSKLPTGVEKWNLGRFRFSPLIVALSSDVSAVSPPPHSSPQCVHASTVRSCSYNDYRLSSLSLCTCVCLVVQVFFSNKT